MSVDIRDMHIRVLEAQDECNALGLKALEIGDSDLAFMLHAAAAKLETAATHMRKRTEIMS